METLEKGNQKLGEICDLLRKDTLEPAQKEAQAIIENAKLESQKIIDHAQKHAEQLIQNAQKKNEQERVLFQTSLDLAAKQTFNKLREEIESELFHHELNHLVNQISLNPEMVAQLVNTVVEVLEREGLEANLTLGLSKNLKPEEFSKYLAKNVLEKLKKNDMTVENIPGGAVLKLKEKEISVDISDQSLKELLGSYLRNSFREILFKNV